MRALIAIAVAVLVLIATAAVGAGTPPTRPMCPTCPVVGRSARVGGGGIATDGGLLVGGSVSMPGSVTVGTLDAGSVTTELLKVGVVDAGVVYAPQVQNIDGGALYIQGGVVVRPADRFVLSGPGGSVQMYWTGTNLAFDTATGRAVFFDGLNSQGTFQAGKASINALELAGGTNGVSVMIIGGLSTPSADAGLDIYPVGNGLVRIWGDGVRAPILGNADAGDIALIRGLSWPLDAVPGACNSTTPRSMRNPVLYLRPDGGLETQLIACDGEEWYTVRPRQDYAYVLTKDAPAQAAVLSVPPEGSTGAITIMNWTPHAIGGSGVTEFNAMQVKPDGGLNILCTLGPIPCDLTPGMTIQKTCPPNRWFRGPSDGGAAQNIIIARDAGCVGQFGQGAGMVGTRVGLCIPGSGVECE